MFLPHTFIQLLWFVLRKPTTPVQLWAASISTSWRFTSIIFGRVWRTSDPMQDCPFPALSDGHNHGLEPSVHSPLSDNRCVFANCNVLHTRLLDVGHGYSDRNTAWC